nr:6760_t:CDS:2 [Entrophospora candida]
MSKCEEKFELKLTSELNSKLNELNKRNDGEDELIGINNLSLGLLETLRIIIDCTKCSIDKKITTSLNELIDVLKKSLNKEREVEVAENKRLAIITSEKFLLDERNYKQSRSPRIALSNSNERDSKVDGLIYD